MRADAAVRARETIARLATAGLGVTPFWHAATAPLRRIVPVDLYPCWFSLDPGSMLVTGHFNPVEPVLDEEIAIMLEYLDQQYADFDRAHAAPAVTRLGEAGDCAGTAGYVQMLGEFRHEVRAELRLDGACWGLVTLHRRHSAAAFDTEDVAFLTSIAPDLAEGTRRGLLASRAAAEPRPLSPGLVLLDENLGIDSVSPEAERWLQDLPGADPSTGRLPLAISAVATRVHRAARGELPSATVTPMARTRSRTGRWVLIHGSPLLRPSGRYTSVIIQAAQPGAVTTLHLQALGLSQREQDVTRLVLRGRSTGDIARELYVSPYTVQDHLKSIFAKTSVRSRGELVSRVIFDSQPVL
jgi:DNA-binding CsgD family transcriptional regulator